MEEDIFISEKRAKILRDIHKHEGLDVCIENAYDEGEQQLCKTLEIDALAEKMEYKTTIKQGSIYEEIKEMEKILKSMPIIR